MKIKVGDRIVDNNGRIGVVTDVRETCIFARPIHHKHREISDLPGVGRAIVITPTAWVVRQDGSLEGLWWDSPLGERLLARLVTEASNA